MIGFIYDFIDDGVMSHEGVKEPKFLDMIRAPFLYAIVVPLISGTIVSVSITGSFDILGFVSVFVIGISLHISTNVYNDIYDTKQGADNLESEKSEYSGGSGILVDRPELLPKMLFVARAGVVMGVSSAVMLSFFLNEDLLLPLWGVVVVSVFFSKYYTAEPVKFAYRGLGEIVVWIGFGPMAVLLAGLGQNLWAHPVLLVVAPITGFGTLFIVWMGEMIDLPTDVRGGKIGMVARMGFQRSKYYLLAIHLFALLNVVILILYFFDPGWPLLIVFVPHAVLLPKLWKSMKGLKRGTDEISRLNFKVYALFSSFLMLGFGLNLLLKLYGS